MLSLPSARPVLRVFTFTLVALLVGLVLTGGVQAHTSRMYAVGYTTGSDWGGGYAEWDYRSLSAYDWSGGGFVAQVLWVYTQNSTSAWMEVGDTHGWKGQNLRTYYWAEGWSAHYYEERITRSYPATGTYVTYQIQAVYDGEYDAYIGGQNYGSSLQSGRTPRIDVGLESTSYNSTAGATQFYWMQYRTWACCTWSYWSNGSSHYDTPANWAWRTNYTHGENWAQ